MSKIIGIDVATTFSCVAVYEGNEAHVINNQEGETSTPSVVFINGETGERKVGTPALRQAITNPKNTIHSIKRLIGRKYDECLDDIKNLQYDVVNENGYPRVKVGEKRYTPQEISAMTIQKMKKSAEDYLGQEVKKAVITVPAFFNDSQRQATKEAAEICGLEVVRMVNEPTAACLAAKIDADGKDKKVMVVDFGGGTADVTILDYGAGVYDILASKGDSQLGGNDFDWAIMNWLVDEFKKENGMDISGDSMAMQRLKEAAENAKIELSTAMSTEISLPYITVVDGAPKHINKTLTRAKFNQICDNLIKRHKKPCDEALKAAKLTANDIDTIVMVGGTSRIPALQEMITTNYGDKIKKGVNFATAIAEGAAMQGAIISGEAGKDIVLLDVTPLSLGIETMGGVMTKLIDANTTIPCKRSEIFSTAVDNQPAVTISVFQGERPMAQDNKNIGIFNLDGIMPARRGVPQIEVTFDIDANGILSVSAKDKATGKEQSIKIEASSSLSKEDIERMKAEAAANEVEDKKRKEKVDKLNSADSMIFQTESMLTEAGDKIPSDIKSEIEAAVSKLKEAHKSENVSEIDAAIADLNKATAKMYQEANPNGGNVDPNAFKDMFGGSNPFNQATTNGGTTSETKTEKANDSDFEEVK